MAGSLVYDELCIKQVLPELLHQRSYSMLKLRSPCGISSPSSKEHQDRGKYPYAKQQTQRSDVVSCAPATSCPYQIGTNPDAMDCIWQKKTKTELMPSGQVVDKYVRVCFESLPARENLSGVRVARTFAACLNTSYCRRQCAWVTSPYQVGKRM